MTLLNDILQKIYAIKNLFGREYWKHAWVVQGVVLARKLVLYCGTDHITLEEMKSACKAVQNGHNFGQKAFSSSGIGNLVWLLVTDGPNLMDRFNSDVSNEGPDLGKLQTQGGLAGRISP
jgi:hypothetical protein